MGIISKILIRLCKKTNIVEKITQKVISLQKKVPGSAQHTDINKLFSKSKNAPSTGGASNGGYINSIFTQNEKLLNKNDYIGRQVSSMTGKNVQTYSTKAAHEATQDIRRYQLSGGYLESILKRPKI